MPGKRAEELIPDEVLELIGKGIPMLAQYVETATGVTLGEWLILWVIRTEGAPKENPRMILMRELVQLLKKRSFSRPNISKLLKSLQQRRLISRRQLDPEERQKLFGSPDGSLQLVTLTSKGEDKIIELKRHLGESFERWHLGQPRKVQLVVSGFRRVAERLAKAVKKPASTRE